MIEKLLANPYARDGTLHPNMHLIYVDEVRRLFKLVGLPEDEVKKKVFPLYLKEKALTWYRLCNDIGTWNYNRLKLEFHHKFYPMHLVHRDRIYNVWPREGESIAQAWGRLMSMLYSCPNRDLLLFIIIMLGFLVMINPCLILLVLVLLLGRLLNSNGIFWKELNATLNIGNSMKVKSQVLNLSLIVLNLL